MYIFSHFLQNWYCKLLQNQEILQLLVNSTYSDVFCNKEVMN